MIIRISKLLTVLFAAFLAVSLMGAVASHAKDVRKSVSADTGADNILMCSMSGFAVETPSAKGCCSEKSGGGYTCTVCSHDGENCANYDLDRKTPQELGTLFEGETLGLAPVAPKKPTGKAAIKRQSTVSGGATTAKE